MNDLANDSVPLVARGFLLALVACLHVAGATALSNFSDSPRLNVGSTILRASWIENPPAASSILPPSSAIQPIEPLPVARPVPPPTRPPVPAQPQPTAIQSAPEPEVVDAAPVVPAASDDSIPAPGIDVAVAKTAVEGTVDGNGDGGEGDRGRDYVGPDFNASYFSNPEPEYPSQSRRLREQGLVKLRVHVTVQGRADEVTLHKSSGYGRLDKAALDAVRHWRFRPAQRAGIPVAGWVVVPIRFELQG